MISRVTMRKVGLAQYLEDGKRADSDFTRHQKDKVIPLYGSLQLLKKAEHYCNEKKAWSNNYEHITLSFSDEDISLLEEKSQSEYLQSLNSMVIDMIKHRTSGYDIDNEVIAYAELHDPKIKEEVNPRTGEVQKRRKHIHIGISYLNPLSDTKLQTSFYNNSYISDTIDKYIAQKNGLTYASAKEPSDRDVDKPSQMTIDRNTLKKVTKDFKTKEELYAYFDRSGIRYDFTNKKSKTKEKNIYVYNSKGGKIHLRGKDFLHIELMHNTTLNDETKGGYLKELKDKSLQELSDILERYYKTHRIPLIDKKRSVETKKVLSAIYEQNKKPIFNDNTNTFISSHSKIFYHHYKASLSTNLKGYFIDVKSDNTVHFVNKAKEIEVTDLGDKITSNSSPKNLEDKVTLMIDIALAKRWNLSSLRITGSDAFKKESYRQIAERIRIENEAKKKKAKKIAESERVKTLTHYLAKENQGRREAEAMPLATLKLNLEAKRVLLYAVEKYKVDLSQYQVTEENKINNLTNRAKPKNVIDFLQKEVNLTIKEAIEVCQALYKAQPLRLETKEPLEISVQMRVNKGHSKDTVTTWEVVEVNGYIDLITRMKQYPYASSKGDNLLLFDVNNSSKNPPFTMEEAKVLLESKGISAMMLPTDEGAREHFRIVIPTQTAISENTEDESYHEFQQLIVESLGLGDVIDTTTLREKNLFYYPSPLNAIPLITETKGIMPILEIETEAIENVKRRRAEQEAERIRQEEQTKASLREESLNRSEEPQKEKPKEPEPQKKVPEKMTKRKQIYRMGMGR